MNLGVLNEMFDLFLHQPDTKGHVRYTTSVFSLINPPVSEIIAVVLTFKECLFQSHSFLQLTNEVSPQKNQGRQETSHFGLFPCF